MNLVYRVSTIGILVMGPLFAFAQGNYVGPRPGAPAVGAGNRPAVPGVGAGNRPGYAGHVPTATATPNVNNVTGIQNNGSNASNKQGQGGAAAAAALAAMAALAAASCPVCPIEASMCPICVGSLIGAAASAMTGKNMDKAQGLSNSQVNAVNPTATPGATQSFATSPLYGAAVEDLEKATKGTGFKVSKDFKTVTTADGRTISSDAAGGGGAASSLSRAELKALNDALKKGQESIKKLGLDGKASGDAVAGGADNNGGGGGAAEAAVAGNSEKKERKPTSVAGAFKDLNGDRIGVAADSMFEMMHRRYQAEAGKDYFLAPKKDEALAK